MKKIIKFKEFFLFSLFLFDPNVLNECLFSHTNGPQSHSSPSSTTPFPQPAPSKHIFCICIYYGVKFSAPFYVIQPLTFTWTDEMPTRLQNRFKINTAYRRSHSLRDRSIDSNPLALCTFVRAPSVNSSTNTGNRTLIAEDILAII